MDDPQRWPTRAHQKPLVLLTAVAMLSTLLAIVVPPLAARAAGTVLFQNSFNNRTVDGTGTVNKPTPTSGTNGACLTATGNSATLPLLSCSTTGDAQGSGKLRLTDNGANLIGGVIGGASFPTSNGLDVTFNSYQWGGGSADGIAFLLAAVDPANPAAATTIGPSGGSLGYSPAGSVKGLPNAYLGVGLDVFGNFSGTGFQGTGCTNAPNIGSQQAGHVVVRGPGNNLAGYCGLTTTSNGTAGSKLVLRAATRAASVVPVQVLINPTTSSFTSDSGVIAAAGTYKVVVKPVGTAVKTLSGSLPSVGSNVYPSSSWLSANGVPKQLSFGFVGSTGSVTDSHEIDNVKVLTFNPVPQLGVSTVSYAAGTSAPGDPVSYVVSSSVLAGANETSPISVTQTVPTGVKAVGAYGSGWVCATPVLQTVTCTTSASNFTQGTSLPVINVVAIVTAASMTTTTIQGSSTVRASSADANPGTDTSASAGTRPAAPSNISITPAISAIAGGGSVTVTGTSTVAPTAIEIGTTAEQQAGTPAVILPCPSSTGASCFTISGSNVIISSMPARAAAAAVTITFVTLGVAGTAAYVYADKPATIAAPSATAGLTSATLSWVVPAENGSAITGYSVTPYLGGVAQTARNFDAGASTRVISGLTAGSSYTFRVTAVNGYGTSAVSPLSNSVTPYSAASAPTITSVKAATASVVLNWSAATSNGGSVVTGYVVTPYIGAVAQSPQTFTGTGLSQTVTGLTPGTAYTFTVAATLLLGTNTLYRINAGGPLVAATDGGADWIADTATDSSLRNNGSLTSSDAGTVALDSTVPVGTPPALFTTQRYDPGSKGNADEMKWTLPVTSGTNVNVRLYFANRFTGTGTVGARVFDVAIDGTTVLSNFDIVAGAGADQTATLREFSVTSDGTINIDFGHEVENPLISAIEVIQSGLPSVGPASARSTTATPNQSPTLNFPAPPAGQVNVVYPNTTLSVTNGTSPFVWSVSSGTLPPGLVLNASSGLLSGTPTVNGSFPVTIRVVDASGQAATKAATLVIAAAPVMTFVPPDGEVSLAYNAQPTVAGGTAPFSWVISAGSLPAGLSLNASTGLISGTPTTAGAATFTVRATDTLAQATTRTVTLTVVALPTFPAGAPEVGQVGVGYTHTFVVNGGSLPLTWSVVGGSVPSGLTLNPTTGVLSGTPTAVGSSAFTVRVVDANAQATTKAVTVVVAAGPLIITKTANVSSAAPGGTVSYTITIANTSGSSFNGVELSDPLTGVLDDATYNANALASAGTVSYTAQNLDWTGSVAANSTVTITYSVTVSNPDTGNKVLANTVASTTLGTNCPSGGSDTRCTATVTVAGLTMAKTANVATTNPGNTVRFTILVTNSGQTAYTGATFTDGLAGTLDDATYNADATATSGSVSFTSPGLTWTGNLAVGASATVTYTVTVTNPDLGNRSVSGTVVSSTPGSTCPSGNPAPSCTAAVTVLVPALAITAAASSSTAIPGQKVTYTITVTNNGQTEYTGIAVTTTFAGVKDDATFNFDAAVTGGGAWSADEAGSLIWTGDLAVGATATLTGSSTVNNPTTGDKSMTTVTSSSAPGSTCPVGNSTAACRTAVVVQVPALTIKKVSNSTSTTPGSVVQYTITVTNSGQTAYTGAAFTDALTGMLDDATYDSNVSATAGTASYAGQTVSWTGDLAVGATSTITYSVTVLATTVRDKTLTNTVVSTTPFNNCPSGSVDAQCRSSIDVLIPGLTFSNVADAPSATPGSKVTYTLTLRNTGQTAYVGLSVTLNVDDVFDDAAYNYDATTTTGSLQPNVDGTVDWILDLPVGQEAAGVLSFTVNPTTTSGHRLVNVAHSEAAGSECPVATASSTAACTSSIPLLIPGLAIAKSANVSTVVPGGVVDYTVSVVNTGETSYPAATFDDSLATVLTDATYSGGATATTGNVSYTGSTLSWTGTLAAGATATISYSVTVRDPDPGDKLLTNTVVSRSEASNCPAGGTDVRCTARVFVTVPGLTMVKTANAATTAPNAVVGYTVTVTNSGATTYTGATFRDDLSAGVLDDATYNADAVASTGTVGASSGVLTWTGDLAIGASATISYSVTVHAADVGDDLVSSTITSTTLGSNCAVGSADTRCAITVPVARLTLAYDDVVDTVQPGGTVFFAPTFTNTGQVPYVNIVVDIAADEMADDVISGNQSASSGNLVLSGTGLTWTGNIDVGDTVTITGNVLVADPDLGNRILGASLQSNAPGNNCPANSLDVRCSVSIDVLVPGLTITKTANTPIAQPGAQVGYTIAIKNTGQTPYTGATVTDPLVGLLDDANYDGNAVASVGSVSLSGSTLNWTGNLPVGVTSTITYSVTVHATSSGDKTMVNVAASTDVGSTCQPGSSSAACRTTVVVLTPALTIVKSANVANATLGSNVTYTVNVTNSGQTPQPGAAVTDSLTGVTDDATYNGDVALVGPGSATYSGGAVSWSGALNPGASAVITYSVHITNPSTGDRTLTNTVISSSPGNNCPADGSDIRCTVAVDVTNAVSLTFTKTSNVSAAAAGGVVTYTVSVTNSSASAVTADFTDSLIDVLDDATFTGTASASIGTTTFTSPNLIWSGTVPPGQTATVTYSVTLFSTFTADSTQRLVGAVSSTSLPGSNNCLVASSTDPRCTNTVTVASLIIEKHYDVSVAVPGQVLRLTSTFTNTGQTPYVGITISNATLDGVDDVLTNGDQTTSSGSIVLTSTAVIWTGDIPVGATVTTTGTVTVKKPDTGDRVIKGSIVSTALGNNCFSGSTDARCAATVNVLIPGLTITKTANAAFVEPGGTTGYTITVYNSGESNYFGASFTDSLAGVLNHATFGEDATASRGVVSYAAPVLNWSGDLTVGQTATITFSVTALSPATGDKVLDNRVVSDTDGSNCPVNSAHAACRSTVAVLTPALTVTASASKATAVPGDVVTYTLTVTNSGQTSYPAANVSAPLAGLLDDAAYGGATATSGTAVRNGSSLDWTGALLPTESATITYSMTVATPVTGDHQLDQTLISSTLGSTCPVDGTDVRCTTAVPIASLLITTAANVATTVPTGVVRYTNTFTNTGKVPYVGIIIVADVTDTADDATYNGDALATSGSASVVAGAPEVSWTGDIPVGATVTFTASVTVLNPDLGNGELVTLARTAAVGSNCPVDSVDPRCRTTVTVLTPGLTISKVADTSTSTPGGVVGYTITVHNTGQSAYVGAEVRDSLDGVTNDVGDGSYDGDPVATSGAASIQGSQLTWIGDVALGQTVAITYSVKISNPDLGDKLLVNSVTSDELGSSCPTGGADPACSTLVSVRIPALAISISADQTTTTPGSTVGYTVIVSNSGQTPYNGVTVTAALAGVLDDGTYGDDATSTLGGDFTFGEGSLVWTGDLAPGQSTTISYTVVVTNPDVGNRALTTSVTSPAAGSTCAALNPCTNVVTVLLPGLAVSTVANVPTATPGDPVMFTITMTNTGQTAYLSTTVSTDLSAVLDDATFDGIVTPTVGLASYDAPTISWTGSLAVGASATITYSVEVREPDPGNQSLLTKVVADAVGSSCPTGSQDPSCTATVTILTPGLTITKSADAETTTPGSRVGYTILVTNTGQTPYDEAVVSDSLAGVLSDSTYNGDAEVVGGGELGYSGSTLTWTGDLLIGATARVTYSVTVDDPDEGDKLMTNTVVSSEPGSSCPLAGTLPACTSSVRVLVPALSISQTADVSTVVAGSPVAYTVVVTNTGETPYAPASFSDSLSGLLDDATYAGDATATIGSVVLTNNTLVWTGPLATGASATITFTVSTLFPAVGNHLLTNSITSASPGSPCVTGSEAGCATSVTVLVPAFAISKTADATEIVAGGTVTYTIIATNTGQVPNPAVTLTDSLAGVLDDATYEGDVTASLGVATVNAGVLNWSGNLPIGAAALITFSVTVNDDAPDQALLNNTVVSSSRGSNCIEGSADLSCTTSISVAASVVTLDSLTPSFTLSGPPNSTVQLDDAVSMTVTTNSAGGYTVTVQAADGEMPGTGANNDTIPIGALRVAESQAGDQGARVYLPMSADTPLTVHNQTSPSGPDGDAVSNDYQVEIPFVAADTYDTTLEYIVTTQ